MAELNMADYYRKKSQDPLEKAALSQNIDFAGNTLAEQAPSSDALATPVMTPKADFSKNTLAEQTPQKSSLAPAIEAGTDAMLMFGDPSIKAAALGIKTMQGIQQAKAQNRMNKYNAEVRKLQARQEAINKLAQIGQGLKA
jgi:hypothetical protein